MYCWEAAKKSQAAITELLLFRKSKGIILRDALPALQRLCATGPFEDCQVRMFVKQRALPRANVCEEGLIAKCECSWSSRTGGSSSYLLLKIKQILQQLKPSTLYMMFQLTLIFYPHHTGMRSQMLYTSGVTWNLPRTNVCKAASKKRLKHLLAEKNIYAQAETVKTAWYVLTQ